MTRNIVIRASFALTALVAFVATVGAGVKWEW